MLAAYTIANGALIRLEEGADLSKAVWIDLLDPNREEDARVDAFLGLDVPTREEMAEIEPSSRLYTEGGARFMTATMMCNTALGAPKTTAVSFILSGERLITVRYDDPKPFALFCSRSVKARSIEMPGAEGVLYGLLDTVIDRLADILEQVGSEIDKVSATVFSEEVNDHARSYKDDLRVLGKKGDLVTKVRESLVSLARILLYLQTDSEGVKVSKESKALVKTMQRDVESLAQHSDYLANKIQFVLDAVLGMVSIEQNNIIKIFAVLSVVFMPPTLIASVYGMNFKTMPELEWLWGYPGALMLMVVSGAIPYFVFKWKRWL